ncbi:MAG: replication protein, partial [Acidobacteriota bacterium]|nr:replication protein [Acidobacteriota bacterium]
MSKNSREVIKDNLARAIAPPSRTGQRSVHLDGLLDEYSPPEQGSSITQPSAINEKNTASQQLIAPSPHEAPPSREAPSQRVAPPQIVGQPLHGGGATRQEAPPSYEGAKLLPANAPHLRFAYEVLDKVFTKLEPYSRVVMLRLYRLSAGWNSETCHVSIGKLSEHCKIGPTKIRACLRQLEHDGYIKRLTIDVSNKNQNERGITFRISLPRIAPSSG